jgi:hypothetical protein
MAAEPNATDPGPVATPTSAAPAQPYAPPRSTFQSAPVGWVIAGMLVFWPTGIPALLASHRAARAFGAADAETAQRESANARRWAIVSVVVGVCLVAFWILLSLAWLAFVVLVHHADGFSYPDGEGWSHSQQFIAPGQPGMPLHPNSDG